MAFFTNAIFSTKDAWAHWPWKFLVFAVEPIIAGNALRRLTR